MLLLHGKSSVSCLCNARLLETGTRRSSTETRKVNWQIGLDVAPWAGSCSARLFASLPVAVGGLALHSGCFIRSPKAYGQPSAQAAAAAEATAENNSTGQGDIGPKSAGRQVEAVSEKGNDILPQVICQITHNSLTFSSGRFTLWSTGKLK
jgi:hypothetical protein